MVESATTQRQAARGRVLIALAACFWSISGLFVTLLHADNMPGIVIACYRSLFAGVVLFASFLVSRLFRRHRPSHDGAAASGAGTALNADSAAFRDLWDWRMLGMIGSFTAMTYFFIESMVRTNPANSVLLQYSATFWILIGSVAWLGEKLDRANVLAVLGGAVGVAVLMIGGWKSGDDDRLGLAFGLISGVAYASVVVHLRALRRFDSLWLASLNHLAAGATLWCFMASTAPHGQAVIPDAASLGKLAAFGVVQMALPYFLFGLGLKHVNSQEAGILTLIEPLLNPLWTFLFAGVATPPATIVGGAILLVTLLFRFAVRR